MKKNLDIPNIEEKIKISSEVMHKTVSLKYISYQFLKKTWGNYFWKVRYLQNAAVLVSSLPLLICF
jgi:hypothetical protein